MTRRLARITSRAFCSSAPRLNHEVGFMSWHVDVLICIAHSDAQVVTKSTDVSLRIGTCCPSCNRLVKHLLASNGNRFALAKRWNVLPRAGGSTLERAGRCSPHVQLGNRPSI